MSSMGHQCKLCIDSATPIDVSSIPLGFVRETIAAKTAVFDPNGVRGTRSHISEIATEGLTDVSGQLVMYPAPAELASLLPYILGAAASGTTFALAETLPDFVLQVDRQRNRFLYEGCKVNRATFRSSAGNPLELTLDIVAKTETVSGTAHPSLTLSTQQPFMHHQCALTFESATRYANQVEIVIDNALLTDLYRTSQTRNEIPEGDRVVTVSTSVPYDATHEDLYDLTTTGGAGTVVYTNGGMSMTFAFAALQVPSVSPTVPGRRAELMLPLQFVARQASTTKELVMTLDSTP